MARTDFDELHVLNGENQYRMRSLDYETYFGEMNLTEEQKEKRKSLSEELEEKIMAVLAFISVLSEFSEIGWNYIELRFQNAFFEVLNDDRGIDEYTTDYISKMSKELTESSKRMLQEENNSEYDKYYATSYDRARSISENSANAIENHNDFTDASEKFGYTKKTWDTMDDKKVRDTHAELEGVTMPIDELFEVGDDLMAYPMDLTYDPDPSEYVNCRCTVTYS